MDGSGRPSATGPAGPGLDGFTDALDYPMYVVTAVEGAERAGCLVGFASQCSIDPPRFMVWLSKANRTYRVARCASHLGVHALRGDQTELAELFGGESGDDTDKFGQIAWTAKRGGVPVLAGACVWFVGRIEERVDAGDHVGFLLAPVEVGPHGPVRPRLLRFGDVADLSPGHPA